MHSQQRFHGNITDLSICHLSLSTLLVTGQGMYGMYQNQIYHYTGLLTKQSKQQKRNILSVIKWYARSDTTLPCHMTSYKPTCGLSASVRIHYAQLSLSPTHSSITLKTVPWNQVFQVPKFQGKSFVTRDSASVNTHWKGNVISLQNNWGCFFKKIRPERGRNKKGLESIMTRATDTM